MILVVQEMRYRVWHVANSTQRSLDQISTIHSGVIPKYKTVNEISQATFEVARTQNVQSEKRLITLLQRLVIKIQLVLRYFTVTIDY